MMKAVNTIVERKIWNEKPVFGADLVTWSRCHTVRWFLIDSHPGKLVPVSYPWRCAVNNNNWRTARSFSARVAYEEHCLPLWNTFVSRKVIATCRLCCVHNHANPVEERLSSSIRSLSIVTRWNLISRSYRFIIIIGITRD